MQAEAIDVVARAIDRHGAVADLHTAQGSGAENSGCRIRARADHLRGHA